MAKCPVKGCRQPEGDVGIIPAGAQVARWLCAQHYALVAAQPGNMGEVIKEVLG